MPTRLAITLLLVGACAAPDELSAVEQDSRPCPGQICGFNSPEVDHNGFHDLLKDGSANDQGLAITEFVKGRNSYRLQVTNGELSGTAPGSLPLVHDALVGAEIHLSLNGSASYAIRIASVGRMPFFAPPAGWVETYVLEYGLMEYGEGPTTWTNVCGGRWIPRDEFLMGPDGDMMWSNAETFGQGPLDSILFDLDWFNMERKTLNRVPDPNRFNIGCAGHTLSKMHLTRNTIASQGAGYAAHWEDRQATLKMLTADYCGDGTAFTVAGQALDWQGGGVLYFSPPGRLEARWTERGAACLEMPRMMRPTTAQGAAAFPDVEKAIAAQCRRPPPCEDRDPNSPSSGLRISALR